MSCRAAAVFVSRIAPVKEAEAPADECPMPGCTAQLCALTLAALLAGCSRPTASWPPAPRNEQERLVMDAALRAVNQFDGWQETACVIERQVGGWRVQAWRIVNPAARGRDRCVPWAVRGIKLDDDAKVIAYENHL